MAERAALGVLLGALVLSPTYQVKLRFAGLEPNVLEILVVAGVGLTIAARPRLRSWRLQWPAVALVAAGTAALLWSSDRHASFGIYRQFLLEPVVAGYALHLLLRRETWLWAAAWAVVGSGLVAAGGEFYSAAVHIGQWRTFDVHPPAGFYLNPNMAATMIVPALAVALGLTLGAERRWRLAAAAAALLLLLGLFVSYSRGGFLGLAGAAVVVWWLGVRRKLPFAAGGLALALLGLFAFPRMLDRLRHELDPGDPNNTVLSRLPIWRAAVRMIEDHPLTGVGLNSFPAQLRRYAPRVTESHTHPHNLLLNLWVAVGLLGLLAYGWVIVWFGRAVAAGVRAGGTLRPVYVGLAAALAAILLHGLVDSTIWKNDLALQFWTLAAIGTAGLER